MSNISHNFESSDSWIPFKDIKPSVFGRELKGDYYGRFFCLVERPFKQEKNSVPPPVNHYNMVNRSLELCYWNDLSKKFQDQNSEWVKVLYWCPVPEVPKHKIENISREEMSLLVLKGKMEILDHEFQKNRLDIPGMWDVIKQGVGFNVSLDTTIYLSTILDENGLEDCMWSIKTNK